MFSTLPSKWVECVNFIGAEYYYNETTGERSTTFPVEMSSDTLNPASAMHISDIYKPYVCPGSVTDSTHRSMANPTAHLNSTSYPSPQRQSVSRHRPPTTPHPDDAPPPPSYESVYPSSIVQKDGSIPPPSYSEAVNGNNDNIAPSAPLSTTLEIGLPDDPNFEDVNSYDRNRNNNPNSNSSPYNFQNSPYNEQPYSSQPFTNQQYNQPSNQNSPYNARPLPDHSGRRNSNHRPDTTPQTPIVNNSSYYSSTPSAQRVEYNPYPTQYDVAIPQNSTVNPSQTHPSIAASLANPNQVIPPYDYMLNDVYKHNYYPYPPNYIYPDPSQYVFDNRADLSQLQTSSLTVPSQVETVSEASSLHNHLESTLFYFSLIGLVALPIAILGFVDILPISLGPSCIILVLYLALNFIQVFCSLLCSRGRGDHDHNKWVKKTRSSSNSRSEIVQKTITMLENPIALALEIVGYQNQTVYNNNRKRGVNVKYNKYHSLIYLPISTYKSLHPSPNHIQSLVDSYSGVGRVEVDMKLMLSASQKTWLQSAIDAEYLRHQGKYEVVEIAPVILIPGSHDQLVLKFGSNTHPSSCCSSYICQLFSSLISCYFFHLLCIKTCERSVTISAAKHVVINTNAPATQYIFPVSSKSGLNKRKNYHDLPYRVLPLYYNMENIQVL